MARKLGVASGFGALFDITGDRIVEHIYIILFTAMGVLNFWVPIIFVTRCFLVDTLRSVAYSREGKTPFGKKSMMRSGLSYFLTASRCSRAIYGVSKVVVFILLGLILIFTEDVSLEFSEISGQLMPALSSISEFLIWTMVVFKLLRGIPVLVDGRYCLFDKCLPRSLKGDA